MDGRTLRSGAVPGSRTVAPERPAPSRGPSPTSGETALGRAGRPAVLTARGLADIQATAGNRAAAQLVAQRRPAPAPVAQRLTIQRAISAEQAEPIARQLEDAMSGWGTDEEAIYGALSGRTGADMAAIRDAYQRLFQEDLDAELEDELTESELARVKEMMPRVADESELSEAEQTTEATNRARVVASQIRDAIDGLGTEEAQIYNALTGRTSAELNEIAAQYLDLTGRDVILDLRGDMSGGELTKALYLFEVAAAGTFENKFEQNMMEGETTVGRGLYNYTLHTDRLEIDVPIKFTPDQGVTVPFALWNQQIDDKWNQFAAKEPGGRKIPIHMTMRNDSGAEREVIVHKNTDPTDPFADRANAGEFYLVMKDDTVPHEFGHFVGLEDEYQRYHADFKRLVGETPIGPDNESGQTVEQIASDIYDALHLDEADDRPEAVKTILRNVGLLVDGRPQQGTFAQGVRIAYDDANSNTLVEDMRDQLPEKKKWTIQTVFSFASRSIMGNPGGLGGVTPHDHAVEPRHLRRFLDIIKTTWPDFNWELGPK